jgi:hypothetical protein
MKSIDGVSTDYSPLVELSSTETFRLDPRRRADAAGTWTAQWRAAR